MEDKQALISPCGLYCGVCAILLAHKNNNQKLKEKLAPVYGFKSEDIHCAGCMSENQDEIFPFCKICAIKRCAIEKGYESCHQCNEFPCKHIESFPIPIGKKIILKEIPKWRELGTELWIKKEEERYKCSECGNQLFRGAKRCNSCGSLLELD